MIVESMEERWESDAIDEAADPEADGKNELEDEGDHDLRRASQQNIEG